MFLSREAVIEAITGAPEFEDGKFSPAKYSAYLAASLGSATEATSSIFRRRFRSRMAGAIADTAIAPRTVVAKINALEAQRREVSDARLEVKQYLPQVKVSDEQVKAHYEANLADFHAGRVRVNYVVLSAEALARREPPSESELRAAYGSRRAVPRRGAAPRQPHPGENEGRSREIDGRIEEESAGSPTWRKIRRTRARRRRAATSAGSAAA